MNIKLIYLYRDGANYKNYNEVVFVNPNKKSKEEIETVIKNHLIDDTWFVALNWNLPDMHFKEFGYDPQIDHDWHEFESIEETVEVVTVETSIEDFLLVVNKTKLPW
jgi:hypothetical protein